MSVNPAPICNHDLPLRPGSTFSATLDRYGICAYDSSLTRKAFAGMASWYERHQLREGAVDQVRALIREQAADQARDAEFSVQLPPSGQVETIRGALESNLPAYGERRRIEQALAGRLKDAAAELRAAGVDAQPMADQAERMMLCRTVGTIGAKDGGEGHVVAWAFKCGDGRLCPDEAREHVRHEAHRYVPEIIKWRNRGRGRRVFYAVFTTPNAPDLAAGIKDMFERWRAFLDELRPVTGADRERWDYGPRKRQVPVWRPGTATEPHPYKRAEDGRPTRLYADDGIHGALVQLEVPLSARGDWNIHLNAMLCVQGRFDFEEVRRRWGFNVHLQEVKGGERELAASMLELIKYAARHVGEKSAGKAAAGESEAPPMIDWPAARLWEFFQASHGARWLRSYGALHGIPDPEPEAASVVWVGRLNFTDAGTYWVDLIQGPNFQAPAGIPHMPGYRVPQIRPPPEPAFFNSRQGRG